MSSALTCASHIANSPQILAGITCTGALTANAKQTSYSLDLLNLLMPTSHTFSSSIWKSKQWSLFPTETLTSYFFNILEHYNKYK